MTPQPIGSFVIVINSKNQILLGERKNSYKSGLYGCPGGRLEFEESLEDCAKRELFEETGLTAHSLKYLGVIRTLQDGGSFIHFAFSCNDYEGQIELREPEKCTEWKFIDSNTLPSNILPAHKAGINLLNKPIVSTYVEILK